MRWQPAASGRPWTWSSSTTGRSPCSWTPTATSQPEVADGTTPASRSTRAHRSREGEGLDLLQGPAAGGASLQADVAPVAPDGNRLQVRDPAAQGALPVHSDGLRVPAGDRLLAA